MIAKPPPARRGFSLVEVLVVIGLVGLLASLILPAVQSAREAANRIRCRDHLRQIGLAFHHYHDTQNIFPIAAFYTWIGGRPVYLNWQVQLLPYIEQEALWRQTYTAYEADWYSNHNPPHTGLSTVMPLYTCPSDGRLATPITDDQGYTAAYGSYLAVIGGTTDDGAVGLQYRGVRISDITDGTSQTLLVGERPPPGRLLVGSWYNSSLSDSSGYWPHDWLWAFRAADQGRCRGPFKFGPGRVENPCDSNHFWSLHRGGAHFVMADGSVHFLSYSAAPIMIALATRAGGEAVSVPD